MAERMKGRQKKMSQRLKVRCNFVNWQKLMRVIYTTMQIYKTEQQLPALAIAWKYQKLLL